MYVPFTTDQSGTCPRGEIVQFAADPELKLSLNSSDPTCIETGTATGLFATSCEAIVTVSLKVPAPGGVVSGVTVIDADARPGVGVRPSLAGGALAGQLGGLVPRFATCRVLEFGCRRIAR